MDNVVFEVYNVILTLVLLFIIWYLLRNTPKQVSAPVDQTQNQQTELEHSKLISEISRTPSQKLNTMLQESDQSFQAQIFRIVLTGGPCAGKTTALSYLNEKISENGFIVYCVPEAATLLNKGGAMIDTSKYSLEGAVKFQTSLLKLQMALEDTFLEIAELKKQKAVILCDRGVMDGRAYCGQRVWQALLDDQGWTNVQLRDRRYELVMHMVTAADGAKDFYTDANNASRYETEEQAIAIDQKLMNAWIGHPHFSIFDNNQSFQQKLKQVYRTVCARIGVSTPSKYFKKFLIRVHNYGVPVLPEDLLIEEVHIEETFLKGSNENEMVRIRKRGSGGNNTYHQIVEFYNQDQSIEKQRQISSREYMSHMENRDPTRKSLKKVRQCFLHEGLQFQLETILNLRHYVTVLRLETDIDSDQLDIPPFIEIVKDITNLNQYRTFNMCKKDHTFAKEDLEMFREVDGYVSDDGGSIKN